MLFRRALIFIAVLAGSAAHAQELRVSNAYARATAPHQPAGAAYIVVENGGENADRLLSAESPVAKSVEIHTMAMEGNVMRMREAGPLEVPAGAKLEMKPGEGYHPMLLGLRQPLKAGERIPLSLRFEKAGKIDVEAGVREIGAHPAAKRQGH